MLCLLYKTKKSEARVLKYRLAPESGWQLIRCPGRVWEVLTTSPGHSSLASSGGPSCICHDSFPP